MVSVAEKKSNNVQLTDMGTNHSMSVW